jgi:cation diffusion facilitator CzcD-associated flavoprotein CzcO
VPKTTFTRSYSDDHHDVVVIGAGPAGLATAAALSRAGVKALVVDRGHPVGTSWRGHYDRLHLHTARWLSQLPGLPIPCTAHCCPGSTRAASTQAARFQLVRDIEALMRDDILVTSHGDTYSLDEIGVAVAQAESVGRQGKVLLVVP